MIRFLLVTLMLFISMHTFAQVVENDTLPPSPTYQQDSIIGFRSLQEPQNVETIEMVAEDHDPNKAAWYSSAIPGLGQAYNKKYWKIPLVWGGIAGFAYVIDWNNDQYQFFRKNLIYETNGNQDGFKNETQLSLQEDLSAISISLPENNSKITGLYYQIFKRLAWEGIALYEVVSTTNEFTILVEDFLVDKAFSVIKKLKS